MFSLKGKTALVTGATGGIGESIARALIEAGARLAISGTRVEKLEQLAKDLGADTVIVPANLGDAASIEQLASEAEKQLGQIDILVNNAGITRDGLAMRMKDEDWETVLNVNLTSAFRLSRAIMKGMMKRRYGRIINIASVVGVMGNPGQANYCAAKAGMIGMTKSIAAELASRGITANCVAPGFIDTAMTEALNAEQRTRINSGIPAGRMGSGTEVAASVLYLASEEAAYVTGQTLHVNGGLYMV